MNLPYTSTIFNVHLGGWLQFKGRVMKIWDLQGARIEGLEVITEIKGGNGPGGICIWLRINNYANYFISFKLNVSLLAFYC